MNTVEELQNIVNDPTKPEPERVQAAEHFLELKRQQVGPVPDDDEEVVELMTPWNDQALAAEWAPYSNPKTLPEAKRIVEGWWKDRILFEAIVDEQQPLLLRLVAVQKVLDGLSPTSDLRQFTPKQLIEWIKPATATRLIFRNASYREVPVARPPKQLSDVW